MIKTRGLLFNVYGYRILAYGPIKKFLSDFLQWAFVKEVKNIKEKFSLIDLLIIPSSKETELPTKPKGCKYGFYIPFNERGKKIFKYHVKTVFKVAIAYIIPLMNWPDKVLIHAAAITDLDEAYVFSGSGNVGKTSIVLAAIGEDKYRILSDDWLIVGNGKAYSTPFPIRIYPYNLITTDSYFDALKKAWGNKIYIKKTKAILWKFLFNHAPHRYIRFALQNLMPVFSLSVKDISPETYQPKNFPIKAFVFLERRKSINRVIIKNDPDAEEIVDKLIAIWYYEWFFFIREYYRYKALFGVTNTRLENLTEKMKSVLKKTLAEVDMLYIVKLPTKANINKRTLSKLINCLK